MTGYEPRGTNLARAASRVAALCVLTCALAACETIIPGETRPADPKSAPERPAVVMPALPGEGGPGQAVAPEQAAPPETAGTATPKPAEPAIAARPPPEPEVNADPERLLGMERAALTDLLGAPAFVRNDAPSYLWRYRDKTCLLDLFLYEDGAAAAKQLKVLHYTVRSNGGGADLSAEQCLKRLLLARTEKSSG